MCCFFRAVMISCLALIVLLAGCFSSSSSSGPEKSQTGSEAAGGAGSQTKQAEQSSEDDPFGIPVMTEVEGIPIPRMKSSEKGAAAGGPIPVDVGNPYAQNNPADPVTGGQIVIRFGAEPKTLNPITESSAYQSYIHEYVQDALAKQDPETLEYLPKLASKWVAEDSVKLAADYPGYVRRIQLADGKPAGELQVEVPQTEEGEKPKTLTFFTRDEQGEPAGRTWVGFFPMEPEKMIGVPAMGYHQWSDAEGKLEVAGFVPGRYLVKTGFDIYGLTEKADDGTLTVSAGTPESPLAKMLKEQNQQSLVLQPDDYSDIQLRTVYTYYLREDAKWSDGAPFTARDLEFAYHVINNPYVDGESLRVYYQDVLECTPLSDHIVRMQYRQQYFKAFEFTAGLAFYAPPYHLFEQFFRDQGKELTLERLTKEQEETQQKVSVHGQTFGKFFNNDEANTYNETPLGVGPYVVSKWQRNESITLERNPAYWDSEDRGYLDKLVFKFIESDVTAFQSLRGGEIDFFYRMTAEQYFDDLKGPPDWFEGEYVKAEWYSPAFSYVGWNMLEERFQDRRVRIALSLLFDNEQWIAKKLHGAAKAVSGSQYFFGPGYDHRVAPLGYSPETARELLEMAGWIDSDGDGVLDKNGQPFRFTVLLSQGKKIIEQQMAFYQESLKDVGIEMEIRTFEWASFLEKILNKDFDASRLSWAQPLESDPYQIWHSSGAGVGKRSSNHVSFRNAQADKFIEMMRVEVDDEKRQQINFAFHRILDREQPYLFLYCPKEFGAYAKRFRGVKWYPIRPGFDLREWYIAKEDQ